ncbi:peptidase M61 [Cryomorpha ignava]|uniref:Peptidase M61 n=1 Tax=Cryomorpha ignava TaxID=101383 RepID=A0A7K3WK01_9FLAO|nr:peptidase M61 [Cryomorpha ignava]NEN21956.1 peptidase M61 [Cryomorpha ignava]
MRFIFTVFLTLTITFLSAQSAGKTDLGYRVEIDVKNMVNDQARVKVFPPEITVDTLVYNMPKIIPGTYSISDFGRYIEDLKAIDKSGDPLNVEKLDENRWAVANATQLQHLEYRVNGTFDDRSSGIFEPSGTKIDSGEVVVLNPYDFVGYFDGFKNTPFAVSVTKPVNFYGETSLPRISGNDTTDVFSAKDYFQLHDCPILYCEPDTASMLVGKTRIAVSVFSPGKKMSSTDVLETVEDLFPAAASYLGGTLPVDQYTILVYLMSGPSMSGGMGALEHNTSTVFVLPDVPIGILGQTIKDVTAHEFFHIVTPLSIHSEQIADYDFMNPQMSAHLWLYEGCTEYAAQHVQVKEGLMPMKEFLTVMRNKIISSSGYDTGIAFTEVSKKVLGEHESQFGNVYEKGALIGMALDLKLRKLSEGEYGTQELMRDLAKAYGPDKPFVDSTLFSEIGRISGYPEATTFLERYVGNPEPLPFEELLGYAGIMFRDSLTEKVVSGGNFSLGYNPKTERMVVVDVKEMDDFGKDLGLEYHDEILEWNGVPIDIENVQEVLNQYKKNIAPGEKVTVLVARKNSKEVNKTKKLKAKSLEIDRTRRDVLEPMDNPSPEQLKIRKSWINA